MSGAAVRLVASAIAILVLEAPLAAFAQTPAPPAATQLPVPGANWVSSGTLTHATPQVDPLSAKAASMLIEQSSLRAVLNWQGFDIGANASVRFNHLAGPAAATLNRIAAGMSPSQIFGSLTANGQVYVYNQSGIIFGQGAQVSVGSLVASSLNITDELFNQQLSSLTGVQPAFTWDAAAASALNIDPSKSLVRIDENAVLTANGGRILIMAPTVVNNGTVSAPGGQVTLAAGGKVYIATSNDPQLRGLLVEVDALPATVNGQPMQLSEVLNDKLGRIVAERGNVTLAALAVNQSGIVRATTSVNLNGSIRLLARDTVVADPTIVNDQVPIGSRPGSLRLGEGSITEVQPDPTDTNTIQDAQTFARSRIEMVGGSILMERNALVRAPSGEVDIAAQSGTIAFQSQAGAPTPGVRFYMDSGSRIDVAGLQGIEVPMERNVVEVELRGNELRDSPLLRDSVLRNKTVRVDIREGTAIADVSGQIAQIGRGVLEKSTPGGSVRVRSEGDIIMRDGSSIDVSGGSVRYLDGRIDTSRLSSAGQIYDIGQATPDRLYDGIVDSYTVSYGRWGVSETFRPFFSGTFEPGYVEGKDAGTAEFIGRAIALDGAISGHTVAGRLQRDASAMPLPGLFILGDQSGLNTALIGGTDQAIYKTPDVLFQRSSSPLPDGFSFESSFAPFAGNVTLSLDRLKDGGMDRIAVYSEGSVRLQRGSNVALGAGGLLAIAARQIDIDADVALAGPVGAPISDPASPCSVKNLCAGEIRLLTRATPTSTQDSLLQRITVGDGVVLGARGGWVNDSRLAGGGTRISPKLIDGGRIVLDSVSDVVLGAHTLLDVSGGGYVSASGALSAGTPGGIVLRSGRFNLSAADPERHAVVLGGELRGYGVSTGGTLEIRSGEVVIGSASGGAAALHLDAGFFQRGGFREYTITGADALTVGAGSQVYAAVDSFVPNKGYALMPSGIGIDSVMGITRLPAYQRNAATLNLLSTNLTTGHVTLDQGSAISIDRGGRVTAQGSIRLAALGTISAPAGSITLSLPTPADQGDGFSATHGIWLGSDTRLLAPGIFVPVVDGSGLLKGAVYDGGTVTVSAQRGYLIAPAGARIDVSGVSAPLDLPQGTASGWTLSRIPVAGNAGTINLAGREGILFDGTFVADAQSPAARGGSLSVYTGIPRGILGFPAFPSNDRVIALGHFGNVVPASLATPASAVDTNAFNGRTLLDVDRVAAGQFDSLALRVENLGNPSADSSARVELSGSATLSLRTAIQMDTPVISGAGGGTFALRAANIALGYSDTTRQRERVSTGGAGALVVESNDLEVFGRVALRGFGTVSLASAGDLRLRGVQDYSAALPEATRGRTLSGGLYAGASLLTLRAAQTYPTTLSRFTIALRDSAAGKVRFESSGVDDPVLSAGGSLTVEAPLIEQAGALKAPLGSISLNGSTGLVLEPGSITSVSGAGQVLPFGRTELTGQDWVYPLGNGINDILSVPPAKSIALSGASVNVAPGARVDMSGGGDLYAYEFLAGPGGSTDVLDPGTFPNTYAIVPWLGLRTSPYDQLYQGTTSGIAQGDLVYLASAAGLSAGYYRLLPARYGLLPGAFVVTTKTGYTDILPGLVRESSLGAQTVAGYRASIAFDGTAIRDARTSGFEVRPGRVIREQSEFHETLGSAFFADATGAQLPQDAGRLAILASQALSVQGQVSSAFASGGRGAEVDIAAAKLAVAGAAGAPGDLTGYVVLAVDDLRRLNANSLLLGGTRTIEGPDSRISVQSTDVRVANSPSDALSGPEILVAAKSTIDVASGSLVSGTGTFAGAPRGLRVGDAADGVSGDGALLRVSSAPQVGLNREAVAAAAGTLTVAATAKLTADQSMILDATKGNSTEGQISLGAQGALRLGAERISIGSAPSGTPGLVVSDAIFQGLPTLASLALRSYSTVDLYGAATLGSPALTSLAIESAGLVGYGDPGVAARLAANTVTLGNPDGRIASASCNACGNSLTLEATRRIELGAAPAGKEFAFLGFGAVTLSGPEIAGSGGGKAHGYGDLRLKADRIGVDTGVDYTVTSDGKLSTMLQSVAAGADSIGGNLTLEGRSLEHGGVVYMPSGNVTLRATGMSAGDDLKLLPGSSVFVSSAMRAFADRIAGIAAGSVTLESQRDASLQGVIALAGQGGGDAGTLRVSVARGSFALDAADLQGSIPTTTAAANAVPPVSGSFLLDANAIGDFAALNRALNAGGFGERREIRTRTGSLAVLAGDDNKVVARNVVLSVDDGDVTVDGTIDASGSKGGSIVLAANRKTADAAPRGTVVLMRNARLDAFATAAPASVADSNGLPFGTRGQGGTVLLSTSGTGSSDTGIDVQDGARINVSSVGIASNGSVTLRAPRTGISTTPVRVKSFDGVVDTNDASAPATLVVEGVKVYSGVSSIGAMEQQTYNTDSTSYMNSATLPASLSAAGFVLRPGVEIQSSGDLALSADWNLFSTSTAASAATRYPTTSPALDRQPGTLTLRAAGNLLLNGSLSDGFTNAGTTGILPIGTLNQRSWSYRLAGGADLNAANPLETIRGGGNVTLASDKMVRTGTGSIEVASGGDLTLSSQTSVIYTAGQRAPTLPGFSVQALASGGAAEFPWNGGDVTILAQGSIVGAPSTQVTTSWLFRQGYFGDSSNFKNQAWWPRFRDFQQGVGALAGGDVRIAAGGNVTNFAVSTSTAGRLPGTFSGGSPLSALDVRGGGDVTLSSGGDIGSAFVYVDRGVGRVTARGAINSSRSTASGAMYSIFALGDAQAGVQAGGGVQIETVFNPLVLQQSRTNLDDVFRQSFFFTYGTDSAIDISSRTGDVALLNRHTGGTPIGDAFGTSVLTDTSARELLTVYPGTVRLLAAAGDVSVRGAMNLYPSGIGGLELLAGNDVGVSQTIYMSDLLPTSLPRVGAPDLTLSATISPLLLRRLYQRPEGHASTILHKGDPDPVRVVALDGDVVGPSDGSTAMGIFAKAATIAAGGDVRNAYFFGQNVDVQDVTRVSAGGDIVFDLLRDANGVQRVNDGRFAVAGPGRLEIFAGRNIDLGNSFGVLTQGNLFNPNLPDSGANILAQAGAGKADYAGFINAYVANVNPAGGESYRHELGVYMRRITGDSRLSDDQAFSQFNALPIDRKIEFADQVFYSELRASGRAAAQTSGGLERYSRGFAAIDALFPEKRNGAVLDYRGDVNLFFSQIKTERGGDIDIMTPGGLVNAGLASPGQLKKPGGQSNLGVLTIRGGSIRAYVREDFLVNQSRVFTLGGGDIMLWASYGDIDAGRGAKTASATPPPQVVIRNDQVVLDTTNSVSGSGIGVLLATAGIAPGDVDLIAPRGEVNAGDAGIRVAGNLNIAALRVLGADNIQVSGASTGVPVAQSTGAVASVAAGAGSTAAAATQGAADLARSGMQDSGYRPSFITVRVLGFGS